MLEGIVVFLAVIGMVTMLIVLSFVVFFLRCWWEDSHQPSKPVQKIKTLQELQEIWNCIPVEEH